MLRPQHATERMEPERIYSEVVVIGAGVIGLAIAKKLSDHNRACIVLEKNKTFGEETSSRNSEVIHAGIYYPQGSLKAQLCVKGKELLYRYSNARNIPHKKVGKLIVATTSEEESELEVIQTKATENQVTDLQPLAKVDILELEPQVKATSALLSPSTGIIDAHQLMLSMTGDIEDSSNTISYQSNVINIEQTASGWQLLVENQDELVSVQCKWLINAAGLHANHLAKMYQPEAPDIHLCRGLYFSYSGRSLFHHLIYPVPEKNTVGLGIHATLDMAGQVKFGPDTEYIQKLSYQFPSNENLFDLKNHWIRAIQRYFPNLNPEKLQPSYAGIRPKLSKANETAKDFKIEGPNEHGLEGVIHLLGIESPGLTASLAIADLVFTKMELD